MVDVGVGEQQEFGGKTKRVDCIDALRLRPDLARPSRRQRLARQHGQAVFEAEIAGRSERDGGRAIGAVIVDDHDVERARIVLLQQRADRAADHVGFIAGGHDRDERGPRAASRDLRSADGVHRGIRKRGRGLRAPEATSRNEQHDPDQE